MPQTAGPGSLLPEEAAAVDRLVTALRERACTQRHRFLLVISGEAEWTDAVALTCARRLNGRTLWLSERALHPDQMPLSAGTGLIGSETDNLVFDAQGGFDPDSFGAAAGSLRAGGLMLLLAPPLDRWAARTDPLARRVAVEPFRPDQLSGLFLERIARLLRAAPQVTLLRQGLAIPSAAVAQPVVRTSDRQAAADSPAACPGQREAWRPKSDLTEDPIRPAGHRDPIDPDCRTRDQQDAIDAVLRTARGRARRPLVMTSDRGRGKSSALGIAAARLLRAGPRRIVVTAPRRSAVEPLFQQAARLLPGAQTTAHRIRCKKGQLLFLPPDAVVGATPRADLLLVDEAAGIPAPLLQSLLAAHGRVVFATTVHGYEGTGRGFDVRFRRSLERLTPGYRSLELRTPIRWAENDPLEAVLSRALLLDAAPAPDDPMSGAAPDNCRYLHVDREQLVRDEARLSELFGLLVLAHYQTRPLDLRHLLDGPNIQIHALLRREHVAATALVALEGGFEAPLAAQVYDGDRRPRGHLLPQTLSAHAGLREAPLLRYARVVRIAVHPAAQGRHLARSLLNRILDQARGDGLDLAGASFGVTPGLLRFWDRCRFTPIHLGSSRNAASGSQAAVVLHPLTDAGKALMNRAQTRLGTRFPVLLAGPLQSLPPAIAVRMLAAGRTHPALAAAPLDWDELGSFAFARRTYEAALPAIHALLCGHLARGLREQRLSESEGCVLVAKVLQHRGWGDTATELGARGRAQVLEMVRGAVGRLVGAYGSEHRPPRPGIGPCP